ncbi:hypothetical protein HPY42_04040 [Coprothermobacteraceae bacterium]|nr:hypothetical protein [Coprothermobacteraceae bacterium]
MRVELSLPCSDEYYKILEKFVAGLGQVWDLSLDQFFELSLVVMKAFEGASRTEGEGHFKVVVAKEPCGQLNLEITTEKCVDPELYRMFVLPYVTEELLKWRHVVVRL